MPTLSPQRSQARDFANQLLDAIEQRANMLTRGISEAEVAAGGGPEQFVGPPQPTEVPFAAPTEERSRVRFTPQNLLMGRPIITPDVQVSGGPRLPTDAQLTPGQEAAVGVARQERPVGGALLGAMDPTGMVQAMSGSDEAFNAMLRELGALPPEMVQATPGTQFFTRGPGGQLEEGPRVPTAREMAPEPQEPYVGFDAEGQPRNFLDRDEYIEAVRRGDVTTERPPRAGIGTQMETARQQREQDSQMRDFRNRTARDASAVGGAIADLQGVSPRELGLPGRAALAAATVPALFGNPEASDQLLRAITGGELGPGELRALQIQLNETLLPIVRGFIQDNTGRLSDRDLAIAESLMGADRNSIVLPVAVQGGMRKLLEVIIKQNLIETRGGLEGGREYPISTEQEWDASVAKIRRLTKGVLDEAAAEALLSDAFAATGGDPAVEMPWLVQEE